jgi:hypothetical protein
MAGSLCKENTQASSTRFSECTDGFAMIWHVGRPTLRSRRLQRFLDRSIHRRRLARALLGDQFGCGSHLENPKCGDCHNRQCPELSRQCAAMTPKAAGRIILSESVLIPLMLHMFRRCRGMKHG